MHDFIEEHILPTLLAITVLALAALIVVGSCNAINHKTISIYLDNEIKDAQQLRHDVQILQTANKGDTVIFHIANFGGDGEGMQYLITAIRNTKAFTESIVEAPSYSAHAYIAASTDKLIMMPDTFLMFHTGSQKNFDCNVAIGQLDRGHDAVQKCKQQMAAMDVIDIQLIQKIGILTQQEKTDIENGYDVYLTANEVILRQKSMSLATVVPVIYDKPGDSLRVKITPSDAVKKLVTIEQSS